MYLSRKKANQAEHTCFCINLLFLGAIYIADGRWEAQRCSTDMWPQQCNTTKPQGVSTLLSISGMKKKTYRCRYALRLDCFKALQVHLNPRSNRLVHHCNISKTTVYCLTISLLQRINSISKGNTYAHMIVESCTKFSVDQALTKSNIETASVSKFTCLQNVCCFVGHHLICQQFNTDLL